MADWCHGERTIGGRPILEGPVGEETQPRQPWRPGLQVPLLAVVLIYLLWGNKESWKENTDAHQERGGLLQTMFSP